MDQYNPYGGNGYGQQNPYAQQSPNAYGDRQDGAGGNGYGSNNGYASNVEMQPYNSAAGNNYGAGLPSRPGQGRTGGLPAGPRGGALPYPTGSAVQGGYGRRPSDNQGAAPAGYGVAGGYGADAYNNAAHPSAPQSHGPSATSSILDDCQAVDTSVTELEGRLHALQQLQRRVLNDQASAAQIERENSDIMAAYRSLGDRLKKIKSNPEAGTQRNAPQVGRVDRRLKKAINDYQRLESDFRRQMQEQQARQYRIVRPDATEEEVRAAVEDPNTQIFQQALLNSDRRGQSQSALSAVRARHVEIQRIEQTIVELAQLFQDLDAIVVQQEPMVANIETKAQEVNENVVKANDELDIGIKSARAARKKKWICLGLTVLIIIIVALVAGIYLGIIKPKQNSSTNTVTTTVTATATKMARSLAERTVAPLPIVQKAARSDLL